MEKREGNWEKVLFVSAVFPSLATDTRVGEGGGGEEEGGVGGKGGMSLPENCLTKFCPRTELKGPSAVYKIQEKINK